jgi:hypothetical protein
MVAGTTTDNTGAWSPAPRLQEGSCAWQTVTTGSPTGQVCSHGRAAAPADSLAAATELAPLRQMVLLGDMPTVCPSTSR